MTSTRVLFDSEFRGLALCTGHTSVTVANCMGSYFILTYNSTRTTSIYVELLIKFISGNITNLSESGNGEYGDVYVGGDYAYYIEGDNDAWPEPENETIIPEKLVRRILYLYISPLLLLVGTLGNLTSLVIMHKLSVKVCTRNH